ncbi:MAG: carboxypeptidase-like regulatory domain-containing protein [Myxococcales bacterium]|nr:carboxypeptidase-like regulatory domain-containing protein [Myxococcales bacterium]
MLIALFFAFRRPVRESATVSRRSAPAETKPAAPRPSYYNRAVWRAGEEEAPGAAPLQQSAIDGNVYDGQGRPLVGAVVSATTFELAGNIPSLAGTVQTDRQGRFHLPLPEGAYQINATHEGYGPSSAVVRTGETVSLVLPASGVVVGQVVDEKKQPVQQFTIEVISVVPASMPAPAPVSSRPVSSADGSFRITELPQWPFIVKATAPGYASAFSSPVTVKPGETKRVDLTLQVGCTLTGHVEDQSGTPVPYVLVDAEARIIAGSAGDHSLQAGNQSQTDTTGRFRLEHVPLGTVLVRAYDGNHAVTTSTLEITSCDKLAPVKLVLSPGGSIAGTARTADGQPLPNARLSVANRTVGFVVARSDAQGRFRFTRLPAGMYRMELHHRGQRTLLNVPVKDGEETKQDITMFVRGKGEIRGRVTAGGRPLASARLLAASGHGDKGVDTYYAVTGPDGSYRFTELPEGLYLVSVITTMKGEGVTVQAGGVVTLDLDVTPRPEPEEPEPDDADDEPRQSLPPPAGASAPNASMTPPAAPSAPQ